MAIADDTDLEYAVSRVLTGSFSVAGQSCISVQRIYVHEKVYPRFVRMFKAGIGKLKLGNPLNPKTDIGTMVDKESVKNSQKMIEQAVSGGAKLLVGGKVRRGRTLEPTVLTDVKISMDVCSKEAFAPLVALFKYRNFKQVVDRVNNSEYGLQAGIFTNRLKDIFFAFKHIECGGVVVNDVPTWRADHQPYGGMKGSGIGREGVRYAIEDMTDIKILSMNLG